MDIFVLQISFIFLPGLIWAAIEAKYALKEKPSQLEYLIRAFMFGLVSYVGVFLLYSFSPVEFTTITYETNDDTTKLLLDGFTDEIFWSVPVALILSVGWLYLANWKIVVRFLQSIKATKSYGDEDVWDFILNSSDKAVEYAHVYDFPKQFIYAGWIDAFSESGKLRELVLRDVKVYNFNGEEVFETPKLYLSRPTDDTTMAFPYKEENDTVKNKQSKKGKKK